MTVSVSLSVWTSVWLAGRGRGRNGRSGFFGDTSVVDSVRIAVNLALKKFRLDEVNVDHCCGAGPFFDRLRAFETSPTFDA